VTFRIPEVTFRIEADDATAVSTKLNVYRVEIPAPSGSVLVALDEFVPDATVHHSLEGSPWTLYERPIHLRVGEEVVAMAEIKGYRTLSPSFLSAVKP